MIVEKSTSQNLNLYYDLFVPDREGDNPLPLLLALHGYEGNKESMMALARRVVGDDFIIASIQGPNSFFVRNDADSQRRKIGFGWMMQYRAEETIRLHHDTLRAVIDQTRLDHPVDLRAVFLLGFSQTVSLNYRFAFTHPGVVRGVVAVCGGIPGDWDDNKYKKSDTDVLIVAGETDEFYPLERTRTFPQAIGRRAGTVEFLHFPVGHVFPRDAVGNIREWMNQHLPSTG